MAKKKKDNPKDEEEILDDENLEEEDSEDTSEDDEENPDDADEETTDDDDSEEDDDDSTGDLISMDAYKGLQRTLSKSQKELLSAQKLLIEQKNEFDEYRSGMDASDVVLKDLQQNLAESLKRVLALEEENATNKVDAMQSEVILNDFPALARFKDYIPSADSKEKYVENAKAFAELMGEKVNEVLDEELEGSTTTVDEEVTGPTQAQLDKAYDKALALAIPGKEKEYNKAMDDYMKLMAQVSK